MAKSQLTAALLFLLKIPMNWRPFMTTRFKETPTPGKRQDISGEGSVQQRRKRIWPLPDHLIGGTSNGEVARFWATGDTRIYLSNVFRTRVLFSTWNFVPCQKVYLTTGIPSNEI